MINTSVVNTIHTVNFQYKWEHCVFRRTTIKVTITNNDTAKKLKSFSKFFLLNQ